MRPCSIRSKSTLPTIGFILALLILPLTESPRAYTENQEDRQLEGYDKQPVPPVGHFVELDLQQQQIADIRTVELAASHKKIEFRAIAQTENLSPLLGLRATYRLAIANRNIAQASLESSAASYHRLESLNKQNAASVKQLQSAKSLWLSDRAQASAKNQEAQNIADQIRQQWGPKIAEWVLQPDADHNLQNLIAQTHSLLLVSLPRNQQLPAQSQEIHVAKTGNRSAAQPAHLVSAATFTSAITQGETWYFITENTGFRSGMRLDAWIPMQTSQTILTIPLSAVVWYAGQPWVYLQSEKERFHREPITAYTDNGDSWLVDAELLETGENIVVQGAQLLLSEENRYLIPEEDDDDDDDEEAEELDED